MDGQRRDAQPMIEVFSHSASRARVLRFLAFGQRPKVRFWARFSAVAFLCLTIGYGVVRGGHLEYENSVWLKLPGKLSSIVGLAADDIRITGLVHQDPENLLATLGVKPGSSLVGFDTNRAKHLLENLDWVAAANVQRLFPNQLEIILTERTPYAIWQRDGSYYVIDHTGSAMSNLSASDMPSLPLVTGEGAQTAAADLVNHIEATPGLSLKLKGAARVGQRRWNLYLDHGVVVMLPEGDISTALTSLQQLDAKEHLLSKGIQTVDLRFPDRIVIGVAEVAVTADNSHKVVDRQTN